jgi:TonB family protein
MKRLQRTCLVASAFTHGLMLLLVFVGSAFVSKKPVIEAPAFELVDIPKILVDEPNVIGGGNPNVTVPQIPEAAMEPISAPPIPEAKPEPVKETPKEPVKPEPAPAEPVKAPAPEPKPKEPDPDSFDLSKVVKKKVQPKPEKPATSFDFAKAEKKTIKPSRDAKESASTDNDARDTRETRVASARAGALSDALKRVQGGLSSVGGSYAVPGPGGNSMSYIIALQKRYRDAWVGAATAGRNGVQVEIEIARDGTVVSSRIIRKSCNAEYDRAAQRTIDRVKKVDPLPEGTKELKRTYRFEITPNELDRG